MGKSCNLLQETIQVIEDSELSQADVAWVGSRDGAYAMDWEAARSVLDVTYDPGFGGQEIANDLVVVFADGSWLERSEYDGAESWDHKTLPQRQPQVRPFSAVMGGTYWSSLAEFNGEKR